MRDALKGWFRRSLDRLKVRGGAAGRRLRSRADYDRVYDKLTPGSLSATEDTLSEDQLFEELTNREGRGSLFLQYYSNDGGLRALRRYGFLELLEEKGFDPIMRGDTTDPARHKLRIYDAAVSPENLLIELVAGFRELELPTGARCRMLFIDWLLMQNPREDFAADEPRLPEQRYPGLGLFIPFGQLIRLMATRVDCDGLMNHPAHYHNAFIYAKVMRFVDPDDEGRFLALRRDLAGVELAVATQAVDDGRVVDQHGEAVVWRGTPQVMPITLRVSRHFESEAYRESVARVRDGVRFEVRAAQD